jgi:hypothetical protein
MSEEQKDLHGINDDLTRRHQQGTAEEIAEWVQRAVTAFAEKAQVDPERIRFAIANAPYPEPQDPSDRSYDLSAKETLQLAFTLGYISGAVRDPDMAAGYEVLLQLLESFHYHYQFQYGFVKGNVEDEIYPRFVVRVPSDKQRHVSIMILPL